MSIDVIFGAYTLPNVLTVQPGSALSETMILGSTQQYRTKTIRVTGHVLERPRSALATAQKDLENALAAIGEATLSYPGTDDFTAIATGFEWEEWNGNPVIQYTVTFKTKENNPFTREVKIADQALIPIPEVSDQYKAHSVDDDISLVHEKEITLSGRFEGSASEVDTFESNIRTWNTSASRIAVKIPSGTYSCKVESFEFGTPDATSEGIAKTYRISFSTDPDYTLEDFQSGDNGMTIIGLSIDVVSSLKHDVTRDVSDAITAESLNISGKKYFTDFTQANNFKSTLDSKVTTKTTHTSVTGKVLLLTNVSYSEPQRDGHFTTGDRRYSLSFNLSFSIDSNTTQSNPGTIFNIIFDNINSVSYSVNIDDKGNVNSRTKSASGKVAEINLPAYRPPEMIIEDGYEYYVTSLSFGAKDDAGLTQVNVSGQTLDSAAAAHDFMEYLFNGFHLDHVTSRSKSVSYSWNDCEEAYIASSINRSVSGFRWDNDGYIEDLVLTIDRQPGTFFFTSCNVGEREYVMYNGSVRTRYTISISGIQYLDRPEDCTKPDDIKIEESRTIEDATTKFAQIPIPGSGIVYKKIGMNPMTEAATVINKARTEEIFRTMAIPADPTTTINPGAYLIKRTTTIQGLRKSVSVKWQKFNV